MRLCIGSEARGLRALAGAVDPLEGEQESHRPRIRAAMRAVVTGGAGFIGSNVVDALLARGDDVHVLDDLSKGRRENVAAAATLHVADIREPDEVFDEVRPDVVAHLAAQADVRVSVDRPAFDADVNVLGTVRILEAARRHDAKVVFSSTGGAIYGECERPAQESDERRPLAPYGTSKLCGEEYLATWNRLYGTTHVALRFGNVYGPRQMPHGEAGVVAIFMGLLREGGTPTVYGDGRQTRDYVFVEDVVRAVVAAFDHDSGVLNVGTGRETSVLELHEAIVRATGIEREPRFTEGRLGELQRSVLDISRTTRELGWEPERSLDEGLAATWRWLEGSA
jgi:UDP-glucose 4-epimerase